MITYFTENDLVSFGNYMISPERKADYAKQLEADKISEWLVQVNTYDIQKWAQVELDKLNAKKENSEGEKLDLEKELLKE